MPRSDVRAPHPQHIYCGRLARPLPPTTTTTTSPGSTSTPSPSLSSRTTTLAVVVAVAVAFLHSFNVTVNDSRTQAAPLPSTRLHHPTGHIHLFPVRRRGFFSRKCPATRAEIYWSNGYPFAICLAVVVA
ncbi:hypothetical protein R3P38DRAFT_3263834 [Favolaschia claudopus]|uniref:Uncharacterized protein n=1 Tax=Favolaschia claudopus TaxID=2862362 RepID=A0AAW0CB57_9AGAR